MYVGRTQSRDLRVHVLNDADRTALGEVLQGGGQSKWNETKAVALARELAARGALQGFGRGRRIQKQAFTLMDLRLNKIEAEKLLSPEDTQIAPAETAVQAVVAGALLGVVFTKGMGGESLGIALGTVFLAAVDQIAYRGGLWFLVVDTVARLPLPLLPGQRYDRRVAVHEAGHFLVAYLLGVLPNGYTLSALDAFRRYEAFSVQAGCTFCDKEFQRETQTNRLSSGTLDVYTCIALAGVAVEYVEFGQAEGGGSDIAQLDALLAALGFSQQKATNQVRWALYNTVVLIRSHLEALRALADAMRKGRPVQDLIAVVESRINTEQLGEAAQDDAVISNASPNKKAGSTLSALRGKV